jgi:probable lipoprotein (TIGR04455 family)
MPSLPRLSLAAAGLLLAASTSTGCSAVRMKRVRPDYEQVDQKATKRLVVVTSPAPAGSQELAQLWSTLARRYVNQKRDFIAKESRVELASDFVAGNACGEGLEGVLLLRPQEVKQEGKGVSAGVFAQLVRCTDKEEVWAAEAGGSWDSEDAQLQSQRAQYVEELGPPVSPYVAPSFRLLSAVLDTLPNPLLDEEDVTEKIELGE